MTHLFDEALTLEYRDGLAVAHTHPAFANVVGPFGGITAATVVRAIEEHPERIGEAVALTVNFAAPLADGEWTLDVRPMRTNRTNQHWVVIGEQAGAVVLTATAVFSVLDSGWGDQEAVAPSAPAFEDLPVSSFPWPLPWLSQYDMRFAIGGPETMGSDESHSIIRLRQASARPWDTTALAAVADAFIPRVLLRRGPRTAFGTVTLTTYFHAPAAELAAVGEELLMEATAGRFSRGSYDQSGAVFSADGALLATTHQAVYFKS